MTLKKTKNLLLDEDELSLNLIEAQYQLRNTRGQSNAKSVLVLVNGIELAGKGEAVKQLREWVDPRYLLVKADAANMFNNTQTYWQPYASFIPAEGQLMVLFGNWYSDLLATALHVSKPLDESQFDTYIANMQAFEQDLKNNHVDVVKVWFDLSWKSLQKRMDNLDPHEVRWHKLHGLDWRNKKQYDSLQKLSQRFTKDWNIIDCEDEKLRNQQFAQIILAAMKNCPEHLSEVETEWEQAPVPELLLHPENQSTTKEDYKKELKELSVKVAEALRFDDRKAIIVFEGMDAAGKGGTIKRLVKNLDPREYDIHSISAPERYEMRHPYLWRFWTKLQTDEDIRIFDRSWYGRVLVERVEGLVSEHAWQRAYDEINRFERDLANSQTVVIKFWLAISKDEQAARFKAREETPNKRFKITPEDWRNREKWDAYLDAAADMFEHTSTTYAPWHIIANDDKNTARLEILRTILKQLRTN
ncbi:MULTISPECIES: polyphosphate:AMP phosphotransferase [unclassified Acinetobacter]|jgi:polyphosphate kinase 2 (PPK2 family)|uniref:polyphosphate:AMP phosphotransferase n=1 Tax=unclassified Acinetobacter TaxID=196816 RepID=UPI000A34CFC4|nr:MULTISPECIES: phosphate--AMP phosphotransferase [unclassified Acinetobacter]OTG74177.1 phosphate--AMP phosphotransferase [Acinetobacter sp. ANC 4218]QQN39708.1 phosphate--AMP phosphotransferase [Acinetobacter sp. CS-2]